MIEAEDKLKELEKFEISACGVDKTEYKKLVKKSDQNYISNETLT